MIDLLYGLAWVMFLATAASAAGLFWVILFRWLVSPPPRKP